MTACTQAVVGSDLAVLTSFIEKLMLAQPMLLFKYQDLKNVFQRLVLTFPCLRENYPGQDSSAIAKKLAEQTTTLACHARRLRDPTRFRECCKGLCEWQVMKLQNLREELARLAEDYEDEQVELDTRGKIRKCEEKTGEGGILKKACSILKKPSTKRAEFDSFVESLELPATQDSCAESTSCPETPSKIQGSRRDFAGAKSKEDLERSDKDLKRHCDEEDEGEEGAGKGSRQGEEGEEGEEGQEDQHERYGFDTERPGQVVLDALQEDGADGCENQKWEAAFPDQLPPGLEKQQPGGRQAHESPAEWKVAGRGVGAKGQDAFEDAGEVIHIPDLDLKMFQNWCSVGNSVSKKCCPG